MNNNLNNDFKDIIDLYFNDIKDFKSLTKIEEKEIWGKYHNTNDKLLKNKYKAEIINRNLKYVVVIAKLYRGRGLTMDDLISEGNVGLCKAFDKFDSTQDIKFYCYAIWWVKQSIHEAIEKRNFIPQDEYIYNNLTDKDYVDNNIFLVDNLFLTQKENIENDKNNINKLLSSLTNREKEIITMYYGLNNTPQHTLYNISEKLNLSKERIRQIKNYSIEKMKKIAL